MRIVFFIFCYFILMISSISFADTPLDKTLEISNKSNVLSPFINRSILSCGDVNNIYVFTSLDIKAILSIANNISQDQIPLTTDWEHFNPPNLNINRSSINPFKDYSADIMKIIFLCSTWIESNKLGLYKVPNSALKSIVDHLRMERPWKIYSQEIAKSIDNISNDSLKEFVYIVLKANIFYSLRGGFDKNPSLWYIPLVWRIP